MTTTQTLTSLPAELRQTILSFVLPTSLSVTWLQPILPVLSVNRLLRKDVMGLFSQWEAPITLRTPTCLQHISLCPLPLPMHARITLDIFYTGSGDRMHSQGDWGNSPTEHRDLVNAWSDGVALLPPEFAGSIDLDITPAPAVKRTQHPLSLYKFVNDVKCRAFLWRHLEVMERLIGRLQQQCPTAEVRFVGAVGHKCAHIVTQMQTHETIAKRVRFEGVWVTSEMATAASLDSAAKSLGKKGNAKRIQAEGKSWLLEPLRRVEWEGNTAWIYAKAAFAEGEAVVKRDLKMIAEWMYDDERHSDAVVGVGESSDEGEVLTMPPASALRRAFQHELAADLGLSTRSEGGGEGRHVIVMRESSDLDGPQTIRPNPTPLSLDQFFSAEALIQAET